MKGARLFAVVGSLLLGLNGNSQNCGGSDCDGDGINDALEQALAERFAPEWRFNRFQPGDGSNQNNNEKNFPISVEKWFEQQEATGDLPYIACSYSVPQPPDPITQAPRPPQQYYHEFPIDDIGDLSEMYNPLNEQTFSSCASTVVEHGVPFKMEIDAFPRDLLGDPDGFPTYFHCYKDGGQVRIAYLLFYAYDEKAMPLDFGDHRVDWAGINVGLSGLNLSQLNDINEAVSAEVSHVWYGGHGKKRFILPNNPNYFHSGTHPRVYVARGSHTSFPRPGEWHNFDVGATDDAPVIGAAITFITGLGLFGWLAGWGIDDYADSADDIFRGDGLIVESWSSERELVNLGESVHDNLPGNLPFNGWLEFCGAMGPDQAFFGSADSPRSAWDKGEWRASITAADTYEWDDLVDLNLDYEEDFEPVNTSAGQGWYATSGAPQAILWRGEKFAGEPWVVTGPGEFPDISELVFTESQFGLAYTGFSILFAGKLRIKLYPQVNFQGSPITITRSKHSVYGIHRSMRIESIEGWTCNAVVDDDASGPEDGSPVNPFNTIQEALDVVEPNGTICIDGGNYSGPLNFNGPVKLRGQGGVVHIGQ